MRMLDPQSIAKKAVFGAALLVLSACATGPARRVSEPAARVQQLTVQADGQWTVELRLENFSSVPMRFDSLDLAVRFGGAESGRLTAGPALIIGPESADTYTVTVTPASAGKLAAADALASGRSVDYVLAGTLLATPDKGRQRTYRIDRSSALSPAPGLPGVLR